MQREENKIEFVAFGKATLSRCNPLEWDGEFKGVPVICINVQPGDVTLIMCDVSEELTQVIKAYHSSEVTDPKAWPFDQIKLAGLPKTPDDKPAKIFVNHGISALSDLVVKALINEGINVVEPENTVSPGKPLFNRWCSYRVKGIDLTNDALKSGRLVIPKNMRNIEGFSGIPIRKDGEDRLRADSRMRLKANGGVLGCLLWETLSYIMYSE